MRIVTLAAIVLLWAPAALAGSEVPPKGAPWQRDLAEAQREALRRDLPIFLYFTKTY
ncbi:MAG: hypothetical protein P1V36_13385 [Planctomycetota bacterium]|nr:hypothetical protein [Planctomycetota bacterium]